MYPASPDHDSIVSSPGTPEIGSCDLSLPRNVIEGKFEVLHKISEGGMGEVYKVRHILLDQPFVIKVIRPQHKGDQDLQERFLREAQAAIRLRHVNIAEIHDFSIGEEGTAYIVMEFIEGATLKQILASHGPFELSLTMEIADQSLKALGFLHRQGYLHRDVSPDNLMLTRSLDDEPLIKLIDLGLAKRLEGGGDLTTTGMFLGKVKYSAPEQFKGEELDPRSDLYSFGVMLYQLLTGHCPIEGEEFSQFIAGHLFKPPRDFEETDPDGRVPAGLRRIVLRTLEKERDRRVATADELAELLAPFRRPDAVDSEDLSQTLELTPAASPDDRTVASPPRPAGEQPREVEVDAGEQLASRVASVARIERHLKNRDLDEATAALAATEQAHGIDDNTAELRTQLESLRRKERTERLKALLEKARRQIAVDEMEEALDTLQEAETLDADNVSVQALLAQVRTTVDRARAVKPKPRGLIWGGAAAATLVVLVALGASVFQRAPDPEAPDPPTAPVRSPAQRSYDLGIAAVQNEDWQAARQLFKKAIEADPNENAEGPYLPYYQLGMVSWKRFNCINALKEWKTSQEQKAIQETPEYPTLLEGQRQCEAELSPRSLKTTLSNAEGLAEHLQAALDNRSLDQLWIESPGLLENANKALQDLDHLRGQIERAVTQKDYRAIDSLEDSILGVEKQLDQLTATLMEKLADGS